MADRIESVPISLGELPPLARARLEISSLASNREVQPQFVLGGPTPPEMKAENERISRERRRRVLAIIEKHDVAEDFLEPLLEEERRLETELSGVRQQIAELRALSKKTEPIQVLEGGNNGQGGHAG